MLCVGYAVGGWYTENTVITTFFLNWSVIRTHQVCDTTNDMPRKWLFDSNHSFFQPQLGVGGVSMSSSAPFINGVFRESVLWALP